MYLNYYAQRGSALVIAVFVIVVMLALALSMARLLSSSAETVVYEVQGNRSLFAAQSGLELALTELFPLNNGTAGCAAVSAAHTFSGPALQGCSASLSCKAYTATTPGAVPLFQLSSTANCVAAGFLTSRTVQIEVRQ